MAGKIFINYRRDDERSMAARIRDRLVHVFGVNSVFMDVDNLLAGQRFDLELEKALGQCDVLLVIIGRRWVDLLAERTGVTKRDYVRDEIAQALKRKIVVIPVLVDGTALPDDAALPDDLRELCLYQKQDVTHERFGRDAEDLVSAIKAVRGPGAHLSRGRSILLRTFGGLILLSLAGAGAYSFYPRFDQRTAAILPVESRGTELDHPNRDKPAVAIAHTADTVVEAEEKAAFAIASSADSASAWEAYLRDHPQSSKSAVARRRLDELNRLAQQQEDERRKQELDEAKRLSDARARAEQQNAALVPAGRNPPSEDRETVEFFRISPMVSQGIHNMRSGPGTGHRLVVSIPASSTGVAVTTQSCRSPDDGKSRHRWCRATWRGHSGWVSMSGLLK